MKRTEWAARRSALARAIEIAAQNIAKENSGKGEPLYHLLGSAAWGRFDGEPCASDSKDNTIFGCGYLEGVRVTAMRAGQAFNLKGTKHLEDIPDWLRRERRNG